LILELEYSPIVFFPVYVMRGGKLGRVGEGEKGGRGEWVSRPKIGLHKM
jgi:hypothetical protein